MTDHTDNLHHRDPETDALIEQLDALASSNRSVPDAGFEQRIMDSISEQIAPAAYPITRAADQHPASYLPGRRFGIAAALLLVGGISMMMWSSLQTTVLPQHQQPKAEQTQVSLEADLDALFDLHDFTSAIDTDIDELDLMTDAMHTQLSVPSVFIEFADSSLTEGSL